jgi:cytochrome b6-f complex iron-sulfur subunit
MTRRPLRRHLDDLAAGRRPRPFRATAADAEELRAAIELRAARPGAAEPREGFVEELHRRLSAELAGPDPDPGSAGEARVPRLGRPSAASGQAASTFGPPASEPVPLRPLARRRLLAHGAGLAAASAAVGAAVDHALTTRAAPEPGSLAPVTGTWQTVAATAELPEGAVRAFDLGTVAGFVHRTGGVATAVSGSCTHQGCRLRLDATGRRLDCPCHTTAFAPSGELITHQLPQAPAPLPRFAVREVDGAVQVYAPSAEV